MIKALVQGQQDAAAMADLAKRRMRSKIDQLTEALTGHVTEHHRFMLGMLMNQVEESEKHIEVVEARIETVLGPFRAEIVARLDTIPGFDRHAAAALIAEIGTDMSRFGDAEHLSSWAGMCPGNHQSAGKRKSGRCADGNRWLRSLLCQTAWAAGRAKGKYFMGQYGRLSRRRGKKRATIAVGHSQLVIAFHLIRDGGIYCDLGLNHFDQLHTQRQADHLVKRLERMGYQVSLHKSAA
jgi:transposase